MSEHLGDRRPRYTARLVVDVEDELAHDHAVGERDDARALLELRVGDESGREARVDRTDVAIDAVDAGCSS